jgi:hypothetical protein
MKLHKNTSSILTISIVLISLICGSALTLSYWNKSFSPLEWSLFTGSEKTEMEKKPVAEKPEKKPASAVIEKVYRSTFFEGEIGRSEENPFDNPMDNVFHVVLDEPLSKEDKVWLTYELNGVQDHSAVSRSINDQWAVGGYFVKKREGWSEQKEEISSDWLVPGDNIIRFAVPEEAKHAYQVRNIGILVQPDQRSDASGAFLVLNQPSGVYYGDKGLVKGFVGGKYSEFAEVYVGGQPVNLQNGEFEAVVKKNG